MENAPCDPAPPTYGIETVQVPNKGDFLVRDGKVTPSFEIELQERIEDFMGWHVWTERTEEERY